MSKEPETNHSSDTDSQQTFDNEQLLIASTSLKFPKVPIKQLPPDPEQTQSFDEPKYYAQSLEIQGNELTKFLDPLELPNESRVNNDDNEPHYLDIDSYENETNEQTQVEGNSITHKKTTDADIHVPYASKDAVCNFVQENPSSIQRVNSLENNDRLLRSDEKENQMISEPQGQREPDSENTGEAHMQKSKSNLLYVRVSKFYSLLKTCLSLLLCLMQKTVFAKVYPYPMICPHSAPKSINKIQTQPPEKRDPGRNPNAPLQSTVKDWPPDISYMSSKSIKNFLDTSQFLHRFG